MKLAFVANLDVELEWAAADYRPSSRMRADMRARAEPLAAAMARRLGIAVTVLEPEITAKPETTAKPEAADRGPFAAVLCWCPTPRALAAAHRLHPPTPPPPAPADAVLRHVNHRAFAAALSPRLPGARYVHTLAELEDALRPPRPAHGHLLKRPYGFAGRGRKHVAADAALAGPLLTWAQASMTEYGRGLQVEPFVSVIADFALHGIVDHTGEVFLGRPTVQRVDADGAWRASRPAESADLWPHELTDLVATGTSVGAALSRAGYFGPFGIDAYRWRDEGGTCHFHALSDINARLSMGFFIGLGDDARRLLVGVP